MTDQSDIDPVTGVSNTGHEWDSIRELDNPLPRWWIWTFYACIAFALGYCIAYPAIPLLHGATPGMLNWSSHGEFDKAVAAADASHAATRAELARMPIEVVPANSPLMASAIEGGRAAFKINCVQCHGTAAQGGKGYPNLTDDDWLWGGALATIHQTIDHGVRSPDDDATRQSQMPAFGRDGILKPDEIQDVVSYVRYVSHQEPASLSASRGKALFANNCAVCHGPDAKGGRSFGAPNLTDPIWLYGGDRSTLTETVTNARHGVMPAWGKRLDPVTVKMLAAYVHSLGGGE